MKTNTTNNAVSGPKDADQKSRQKSESRLAPVMFFASLVFLVLLAALIVVLVDMPRVDAMASTNAQTSTDDLKQLGAPSGLANYFMFAMFATWLLFPAELAARYLLRNRELPFWNGRRAHLWAAICPPLRLALPCREMQGKIWLPTIGWKRPGKQLHRQLEKTFSTPMLVIALLILPVLLVEFGLTGYVDRNEWLRTTLHICTGLIWFAFALEFIVMVSSTNKRLNYVKKNWIDLAIVLLPLISFLRSLRVVRAAKVARFAKMQQLAKMTRVYRMRGLFAKTVRALLLLEIVNRVLRVTPEKQLEKLQSQFDERKEELQELQEQIEELKSKVAAQTAQEKAQSESQENESDDPDEDDHSKNAA